MVVTTPPTTASTRRAAPQNGQQGSVSRWWQRQVGQGSIRVSVHAEHSRRRRIGSPPPVDADSPPAMLLLLPAACPPPPDSVAALPDICDETPTGAVTPPADDTVHDAPVEWWYWTGHLQDEAGRWYGFEQVFFLFAF